MTTTHKSLRGPRGAMIFFRKGVRNVDKKGKGKFGWLAVKWLIAVFAAYTSFAFILTGLFIYRNHV